MNKKRIALTAAIVIGITAYSGAESFAETYHGWKESDGCWYYYNDVGSVCTGWVNDAGKWYYLNDDGTMKRGWLYYGGQWYYLLEDGSMASDMIADGCYLNEQGIWEKSYDNKVSIKLDKQFYNLSNGAAVKLKIINTSNNEISYDRDFIIEKFSEYDRRWQKIENEENLNKEYVLDEANIGIVHLDGSIETLDKENIGIVDKKDIGNLHKEDIKAASGTVVNDILDLSPYKDKLYFNKYRIGVKVNGEYLYHEIWMGNKDEKIQPVHVIYYLNETESIPFVIMNGTDKKMIYDSEYSIEKYTSSGWVELSLKNSSFEDIKIELQPGEAAYVSVPLDNIDEKLTDAVYRIKKEFDGEVKYAEFSLSNDNIVTMSSDKESYWQDDKIEIKINNETDKDLSYGSGYKVEKWNPGQGWREIYSKSDLEGEAPTVLKANGRNIETINVDNVNIDRNDEDGFYKFTKEIDGNEYVVQIYYGTGIIDYGLRYESRY